MTKDIIISSGSIGTTIAVVVSYSINKSILWATIHGIFGWFYVFYHLGGCGRPVLGG